MKMPIKWLAVAMIVAAGLAPASPAAALDWQDCKDGLQCAQLPVPVDWAHPDGPKTTVQLGKLPAKDQAHKLGSLVVNAGGPSTTIGTVRAFPKTVSELTNWYDVVLLDPRGFGEKPGAGLVECPVRSPGMAALEQVRNEAEWDAYAKANKAYDASCRQVAGASYRGWTSWQIAHDLDAVRASLGESKLRYFGNSYGTVYGQAYLELFPDRVGRMFLDGVADHTQPDLRKWILNYAITQERQLTNFKRWCASKAGCALADVIKTYDSLLAKTPLPAGSGPAMTADQFVAGVMSGLTGPPSWPLLADAMQKAQNGDASELVARFFPPSNGSGPSYPGQASLCHDFQLSIPDYQQFRGFEAQLKKVAPRVGWMEGRFEVGRCLGIPTDVAYPRHPLRTHDLPPTLISIGKLDSNTANLNAAQLASQVPAGRVIWSGDGHAAYLAQSNLGLGATCLRTAVNRYLVSGALPAPGTFCPGDAMAHT
jgi:pimeloyl-ACP methyl ester carboxylesterase